MPNKDQIITNPLSGDTYEFVRIPNDANREDLTLKATIKTKGPLVPKHYHIFQEETFEVIKGKLTILLNNQTKILTTGEKIVLPENKPHNHYNNEDTPVTYMHTISPGLDFGYQIESLVGLASDGKTKNGEYGLIQVLVFLKYLDSKTYMADIPIGIQKVLMNIIAPIGRVFGYRAIYEKYSGIEK